MPTTAAAKSRQRLSVWAGRSFLFSDKIVAPGKHIVDDISLLATFTNTTSLTAPMDATYDRVWRPPAAFGTMLIDTIRRCHRHGIQCLAGYDLVHDNIKTTRFHAWLDALVKHANPDAEIDRFTQQLADLVVNPARAATAPHPFDTFDGISFDFEHISTTQAKKWAPILTKFYRSIAKKLRHPDGDRLVAVAMGGMVSDVHADFGRSGHPKNLANARKAFGPGLAHNYGMAVGNNNLVLRPMAYDNFTIKPHTPDALVKEWHKDVINHAIGPEPGKPTPPVVAGVPRGTFQLGIKNFAGPSNKALDPNKPKNKQAAKNLDATLGHAAVQDRSRLVRKRGVGLVIFAFPTTIVLKTGAKLPRATSIAEAFWKKVQKYNFEMNGPVFTSHSDPTKVGTADTSKFDPNNPSKHTIVPGLASGPDQVPLGKAGVTRLKKP